MDILRSDMNIFGVILAITTVIAVIALLLILLLFKAISVLVDDMAKKNLDIPLVVGVFFQVNFLVLSKHVNYQIFVNVTYFDTFKIFSVINTVYIPP